MGIIYKIKLKMFVKGSLFYQLEHLASRSGPKIRALGQ